MKRRQFQALREQTTARLEHELRGRTESLVKLGEDLESGKVKNVKAVRAIEKEIAQILTLLREKATAGQALIREKKSV